MRKPARRTGFTLMELLAVMAIIMLLASILMPTVTKMRLFAMDSQCRALIHNIGSACSTYVGDHAGVMPTAARDANGAYRDLVKYQPGPWYDPRCKLRRMGHYGIPEGPGVLLDASGNRSSGTVTGGWGDTSAGVGPVMFTHITSPSTTAGLACFAPFKNPHTYGAYAEIDDPVSGGMRPSSAANSPWAMHGGSNDETNVFLLDGQVRSFSWGEIIYSANFSNPLTQGGKLAIGPGGGPAGYAARQYLWTGLTKANTDDASLIGWLTK